MSIGFDLAINNKRHFLLYPNAYTRNIFATKQREKLEVRVKRCRNQAIHAFQHTVEIFPLSRMAKSRGLHVAKSETSWMSVSFFAQTSTVESRIPQYAFSSLWRISGDWHKGFITLEYLIKMGRQL